MFPLQEWFATSQPRSMHNGTPMWPLGRRATGAFPGEDHDLPGMTRLTHVHPQSITECLMGRCLCYVSMPSVCSTGVYPPKCTWMNCYFTFTTGSASASYYLEPLESKGCLLHIIRTPLVAPILGPESDVCIRQLGHIGSLVTGVLPRFCFDVPPVKVNLARSHVSRAGPGSPDPGPAVRRC